MNVLSCFTSMPNLCGTCRVCVTFPELTSLLLGAVHKVPQLSFLPFLPIPQARTLPRPSIISRRHLLPHNQGSEATFPGLSMETWRRDWCMACPFSSLAALSSAGHKGKLGLKGGGFLPFSFCLAIARDKFHSTRV